MSDVQNITEDIIALLDHALVATEAPAAHFPDHIRRELDKDDHDPDEPTGNDPYYEEAVGEEEDDEDEVVDKADMTTDDEIADGHLDEIKAAHDAEADVADEEPLMVQPEPPATPMIVTVLQQNLKTALNLVEPFAARPAPLPVLANVLLEAEDSRLKISATDLESSISVWIGAKQEQTGAITIDARIIKDYIGILSPERVDFRVDNTTHTMNVRCGVQTGELRGIDDKEFPPIGHNETPADLLVPAEALLRMLDSVIKCSAREQNRPILCGVHMHLEKGMMTLAGADGCRLGVERLPVDYAAEEEHLTLPSDTVKKLLRVLRGHKDTEVGITLPCERNSVTFTLPNIQVSTQLLEGRFPDFMSIVPRSWFTQAVFYADDMKVALKRAAIFAKDDANSCAVSIEPARRPGEPALMTVSAKRPERGETEAMLDAKAEGEKVSWSGNYQYLLDAIETYRKDAERIVININGPENPVVIRPETATLESVADSGSLTVIMPMS